MRLGRLFHGISLADLGAEVSVSKQYLSRLENGAEPTAPQALELSLAERLEVLPDFFYRLDPNPITEEQCHFRRQLTTKVALRQVARARGEMLKRLVDVLDEQIHLPDLEVPAANPEKSEQIEAAAEAFRSKFGLGKGPIANVTRVAENAGAVVFRTSGIASEIDAVSFATKRPVIALNREGKSVCRARFGVAHELGHLSMHTGVLTGDRLTETQANRFASALLMPRTSFATECQQAVGGQRLRWGVLSELKLRWGVSKAASIYRAKQLGVFSEDQFRAGFIGLKRHGEAIVEAEDHLVTPEVPEVLAEGLELLKAHFGLPHPAVARKMLVQPRLLSRLLELDVPPHAHLTNVVELGIRRSA
ncbi:MAG: XRE family transcriptional regulator [Usitatibacteraceae bacterium]